MSFKSCFHAAVALLTVVVATPGIVFAQFEDVTPRIADDTRLYCDALTYWTPAGGPRLDVYIEVPYNGLHFTKVNDSFHASYNVTVDIHDSTDRLVDDKYWTETIDTKSYEESISPKANRLSQQSFELAPGTYALTIQVNDVDTKKTFQIRRRVVIRDNSGHDFFFSDPMIVNHIDTVGEKRVVYPNITGNVGNLPEGFFVLLEFYNRSKLDSVTAAYVVKNYRGEVVLSDSQRFYVGSPKKSLFLKVNSQKLLAGDYILDVRAFGSADHSQPLYSASRLFVIHWRGLPVTIVDLDQAVDELQYIADKDAIDEIKKAPLDQKKDLFKQFWAKRDPTPGTDRNELMEEYYTRVDYANKHFGHYIDGWKTDMGMIYIIFGMPNNIERHPFDIDAKPYEIWTYYEQNREFVFVDATGFGDYRLQNPVWDLWRTRPH